MLCNRPVISFSSSLDGSDTADLCICAYYLLAFLDFSPVLYHFSWKAESEGENLVFFSLMFANQPGSTGAVQQEHLNLSSSSSVLVLVLMVMSRSGLE